MLKNFTPGMGVYFNEMGGNSKQTIILFWPNEKHSKSKILHKTFFIYRYLKIQYIKPNETKFD